MKPIEFKEQNVVFAKDQKPYLPLPAYRDERQIIHLWKLTARERIKVFFTGKLWAQVLNFDNSPQPIKLMVDNPFIASKGE